MAKDKSSWSESELAESKNATKSGKAKRHCARFWWAYLLAIIVIIVVIVVIILFAVIPKTAQSTVNKATVNVTNQVQYNPGPSTFSLNLTTTVDSETDRQATIQGFNASFYLPDNNPDTPFVYVPFPATESQPQVQTVDISGVNLPVANMNQFIEYNKMVLLSETFQVGVRGKSHVVLNGLPKYGVTYDKVATMKGFNKFDGFQIEQIQFHNPPEFDGATMTGKTMIPNPSVISAQFGNLTLQLSSNGTYLGYSVLPYVELVPGNNTFDMRSYIDLTQALAFVHDDVLDLEIVGNSSVNIAGEHLVYFEEALKANVMHYSLNLTEAAQGSSK